MVPWTDAPPIPFQCEGHEVPLSKFVLTTVVRAEAGAATAKRESKKAPAKRAEIRAFFFM
jgi:hypothetical protein